MITLTLLGNGNGFIISTIFLGNYLEDKFLPRLNDATRQVKTARQTNAQVVAKLAREGNLGDLLKKVFPLERLRPPVPATPPPALASARKRPASDADPATPPPARLMLPPSQRRPDSTPVPSTR